MMYVPVIAFKDVAEKPPVVVGVFFDESAAIRALIQALKERWLIDEDEKPCETLDDIEELCNSYYGETWTYTIHKQI